MTKGMVYLGATIGGGIGSVIPMLFGSSDLSGWSILGGLIGGLAGVWVVYKFFN